MSAIAREMLERASTIVVVGLSTHPHKTAHRIPAVMQQLGYRVVPVHPTADEILGETAYPSLADVSVPLELVNVFRPSAEAAQVAADAVAAGAKGVWLQQGIMSAQARRIAEEAGVDYVEDACIMIEARRYAIDKQD